jgi:hypothetical protein
VAVDIEQQSSKAVLKFSKKIRAVKADIIKGQQNFGPCLTALVKKVENRQFTTS